MTRGDLEILEDWCYEAPFNILATPIRQARQMGYIISSRVRFIKHRENVVLDHPKTYI